MTYNEQEMTWNDLQQPTTSKKQPETTYNDLQQARNNLKQPTTGKKWPEINWNDPQQARNNLKQSTMSNKQHETTYKDLKRPTTNKTRPGKDLQSARNDLKQPKTSKTQPITTWTYLQRAKKRHKTTGNKQIFRYFTIQGKRFSSLIYFPPNIWLQWFEHCFMKNHGHNRASNISIVSSVFFMGYKIYFYLSGFHVKKINKSQDSRERERLLFFFSSLPLPPVWQMVQFSAFTVIREV